MADSHLVVDGSNIATEGRSLPSLKQLLDAVGAVSKEFSYDNVTVIVDATFGHRIDASERDAYEDKANKGEIITPPAGVIGRGDAFILEVADRADAVVLSNDSFQEFHGTYDWLFHEGRLLGGKHVPGVGWIFLNRSPVRGPTSRRAVSDAKRKRRGSKKAAKSKPAPKRPSSKSSAPRSKKAKAEAEPKTSAKDKTDSGRKRGGKEPEPYNEPLPFIEFVGAHPVGSVIEAEVEQFSSHGAYVVCDGTRCYISLKSISDPPPRSAREVLTVGETREFVVQAIDTPRRGIDLALPGMEEISPEDLPEEDELAGDAAAPATSEQAAPEPGRAREPVAETALDEVEAGPEAADVDERKLSVSQRRKLRARQQAEAAEQEEAAERSARKAATRKKPAARKAGTRKKGATKKATAKKKSAPKKAGSAKKAPPKRSAAKKKTAAKKKSAAKKTGAKKSAPKKAGTATKAQPKKSTAKKKSAAKKTGAKKSAPKKTAGAKKKAPTKKTSARKRPASSDDGS